MRIYDVSVPISTTTTPVYPGDPRIEINSASAISNGDAANVSLLNFGVHTATHTDAPAHFIEGAATVRQLPLEVLLGRARVVEVPLDVRAVDAGHVSADVLNGATRVLLKTRNSAFWQESSNNFREDFTYITPAAARSLVHQGVRLVGIDYLSVDEFGSANYETHRVLLGSSVVIIEGLNLAEVPAGDYELICLPLLIASGTGDGAPARTILRSWD